eukprot:1187435-Prorocentrum_minimum.AAC.5
MRAQVGEVGKRLKKTFVVEKTLSEGSNLVEVTLERPLGIIFTPDLQQTRAQGLVRVAELVEGGEAEQRAKLARLGRARDSAVLEGDVLRAFTATVLRYPFKCANP